MFNFFFATIVEKLKRNASADILIYLTMLVCILSMRDISFHRPIFFFWILLLHHIWSNLLFSFSLLAKRNILYFQIWIHASFLNSGFHIFGFIQRAEFLLNSCTLLR